MSVGVWESIGHILPNDELTLITAVDIDNICLVCGAYDKLQFNITMDVTDYV